MTESWTQWDYSDDPSEFLLGECENGYLYAPARHSDAWRPFKWWKLRHALRYLNSRRRKRFVWLTQ